MLFSVETQTTEERTQQYQSEIESIYKDLTTKGKALMLSTELGVRFISRVNWKLCGPIHNKKQMHVKCILSSKNGKYSHVPPDDVMFFSVLNDCKLIIFGFWTVS